MNKVSVLNVLSLLQLGGARIFMLLCRMSSSALLEDICSQISSCLAAVDSGLLPESNLPGMWTSLSTHL